jgi:hypothetical protein
MLGRHVRSGLVLAAKLGFDSLMNAAILAASAFAGATFAALAAPALAQTPAARCDVQAQSRIGGAMEVAPAAAIKNATGPQLIWQPMGSGPRVVLFVTYPASALAHMDEPNGVLIRFRIPANHLVESLSLSVKGRDGRAWRFDGATIVKDSDDWAHVAFGLDWPYGRGVLSAIADGQPLAVSVDQDGQSLASESFALSNIDARDSLLADVRAKYAAVKGACAPAP